LATQRTETLFLRIFFARPSSSEIVWHDTTHAAHALTTTVVLGETFCVARRVMDGSVACLLSLSLSLSHTHTHTHASSPQYNREVGRLLPRAGEGTQNARHLRAHQDQARHRVAEGWRRLQAPRPTLNHAGGRRRLRNPVSAPTRRARGTTAE